MTGKSRISNWQDKHLRKMDNLIHESLFQQDIAQINISSDYENYSSSIYRLAEKWKVQPTILLRYIKDHNLLASSVSPSLSIIYDKDETAGPADSLEEAQFNYVAMRGFPNDGINLFIPPGSSQVEIASFVKENWGYIESKIGKPLRNRRRTVAERDLKIFSLHTEGKTNREIEMMFATQKGTTLTADEIGRIIREIQQDK